MVLSQRVVMAIMVFLGISVSFTMRSCLSIAITEMVVPMNKTGESNTSFICSVESASTTTISIDKPDGIRFNWTQEQQGWILSAFFIGYVISHIPGGILAEVFGGKWTLSLSILIITICNAAIPQATQYFGFNILMILRIVMGLAAGTIFPAVNVLLAAWVPLKERGKLGTFVLSGSVIGNLLTFYVSGLILSYQPWSIVYYFWSVISIVWFIIFTLICSNDAASHPYITNMELTYLRSEMKQLKRQNDLPSTPWKSILTSVPVIALLICQVGNDWTFYILASDLPKYMKEVLGFSVYDIGIYTSLPYLFMFIVSTSAGYLSDYLVAKNFITLLQTRIWFTVFSAFCPAILIVAASYAGCNRMLVVILFTMAMSFMGFYYPGFRLNSLDLSPNYAGSLMALTNGASALMGIAAPNFVGIMAPDSSLEQWRFVFWITFGITIARTIVYFIWASVDVQPWNNTKEIDLTEGKKLTDTEKIRDSV